MKIEKIGRNSLRVPFVCGNKFMLETPARIEPCLFVNEQIPPPLNNLAVEIQRAANGLRRGLHFDRASELADLLRFIN
jgi:hypothetical protein